MHTQQTYRTHAIYAGILFIIATVFLFVGEAFYKPGLTPPDVLTKAVDAKSQINLGILIELSCVLSIPLIAIVLYPVLRLASPMLAVGYVAFRVFEASLFADMESEKLLVLAISESLAAQPDIGTETLEVFAQSLTGGGPVSGTSGPIYNLVFVIGMLMLNWVLWQARLVPRWISGWGIVSALTLGGIAISVFFVPIADVVAIALIAPLAIQEMVLALWFIFRGFSQRAIVELSLAS